ncbi:MAG TPA: hypothetical protein PK331_11685 [Gordonia sp. (in: high G+C Gram-positive bacteria)]|uniref:hypothetical protein n=1 Tax=unclassified Gordonia (in: high G+C Gram-positive bacteria) TaxID=2657482 RepID=UPI000F99A41A|nr:MULTISPECIES: hypothetical protein [unclassified Gordonia (in: high G+C Gram-positive bacteria)]RUP37750.1 MAG: hypothetical protein EKK60_11205 [Gordonia sp. (in: high G+C Gram-positive bacteria)]HNP55406.1 hypothetical protein [Gordonia sp. (in: high G+C Gram-positive bacteria)]HRC51564.1 hypothetical protein [Gordonia sp. (in: high G+C Gram-positive bacteria)]
MGEAAIDPAIAQLRQAMSRMSTTTGGAAPRVDPDTRPGEDGLVPDVLSVPENLAELFPQGGLARGSVVSASGAGSLLLSMIAASSGAGAQVAVVGLSRLSMLAAAEMGADLSRIALVADPGSDPLQIATVLLDGIDLVVLGLDGMSVPPSRAKVLAARARRNSSVLLVVGGQWPGAAAHLSARVSRYRTATPGGSDPAPGACGYGRIGGWDLSVSLRSRSRPPRSATVAAGARR